ncbi:MAG: L,D-transpeptidase family protein [Candidatus Omnitrophica bacterium]|nr:L,D-transpeptidase family protein [Candidatus Omnitrophota bacterium]MDD5574432.1 L,D-transpeptidase family protein [Candidatus Omnitrophota bacterium]
MKKNILMAVLAVFAVAVLAFVIFRVRAAHSVSRQGQAVLAPGGLEKELSEAQKLFDQGELLRARDVLREIFIQNASRPGIEAIQKKLEDVNMKIILSGVDVPGETAWREVKKGDTLSMIADEYRTTVEMIRRQNGLSSDTIRVGMRLRIWTGRFSVLVDKSQNTLTLLSGGEAVKTYRISTGKDNITPVGAFKIVNKLKNPSWTHEGKVYPPESPENILGTRWMGFDIPGYGIHGTTQPESIGSQATAGCVRMLNDEVEELYDLLPVNTEVTVID